jgi:hypothetical protein
MHLSGWLRRRRCTAWIARCGFAVALVAAVPLPAVAQLSAIEIASVRIIYFEGSEGYLVPHAARTFLNSLSF